MINIIQLIYVSSAYHNMSDDELQSILDSAVQHNAQNGVTGLLLYFDGSFMQVVEGPEDSVDELMGRLQRDSRHRDINVLSKSLVTDREFPQWSMGFKSIARVDMAKHPHYAPFFSQGFDDTQLSKPGVAIEFIRAVSSP